MECFGKPELTELNKEKLQNLKLKKVSEEYRCKVKKNWDAIAKPIDGMGDFEELISKIGAIKEDSDVSLDKKVLVIFCSDNGITDEGISQSGREVTLSVAQNMARKKSSVEVMAERNGIETLLVDIGIDSDERIENCIDRKIRKGTRNFAKEMAMTEEEMLKAVSVGIDLVRLCKEKGADIIAAGEMGIGNTTTSSAVTAALLHMGAKEVTGRGAGLDDERLSKKIKVIDDAIEKYNLYNADAFEVLSSVGGYDLAGLCGVCIGGALYGIPVVLDGFITLSAALLAERMVPGTKDYLIASHVGKEKACSIILNELDLKACIDANMALGEGTGAVMMLTLLDNALCVYKEAAVFDNLNMEEYKRFK